MGCCLAYSDLRPLADIEEVGGLVVVLSAVSFLLLLISVSCSTAANYFVRARKARLQGRVLWC